MQERGSRVARIQAALSVVECAAPSLPAAMKGLQSARTEPQACPYQRPPPDWRAARGTGVGILSFRCLKDVQRAVAGVLAHTRQPCRILVLDNSENSEVADWAGRRPEIDCLRSPTIVGCANGRNWLAGWFAARGYEHFVLMDQDVEPVGDAWVADMRSVFRRHPDTGIATWHLATRQMSPGKPGYAPDATGAIVETPGMCCMYSRECIEAVVQQAQRDGCPDCRPWNMRMLMYRFDTLFCLLAAKAGFKTRVVWPDTDKVRHNHPHKGVQRNPRWRDEQARSRRIFAEEMVRHGLGRPSGLG